jgi:hypothetical protein
MNATVLRCIGGGVLALALWGVTQIGYAVWLCPFDQARRNAQHGTTTVIVENGERVRRTHDVLFVCETTHYLGPMALHYDLDCYCAPETMSVTDVAQSVDGSCVADSTGSAARCAHGHCNRYLP